MAKKVAPKKCPDCGKSPCACKGMKGGKKGKGKGGYAWGGPTGSDAKGL